MNHEMFELLNSVLIPEHLIEFDINSKLGDGYICLTY